MRDRCPGIGQNEESRNNMAGHRGNDSIDDDFIYDVVPRSSHAVKIFTLHFMVGRFHRRARSIIYKAQDSPLPRRNLFHQGRHNVRKREKFDFSDKTAIR